MSAERYKRTLDDLKTCMGNLHSIGRPTVDKFGRATQDICLLANAVASYLQQAIDKAEELAGQTALAEDRMGHNATRESERRRLDDIEERELEAARLAALHNAMVRGF